MPYPARTHNSLVPDVLLAAAVLPLLAQVSDAPWRAMIESPAQVHAYLERAARRLTDRAAFDVGAVHGRAVWKRGPARMIECGRATITRWQQVGGSAIQAYASDVQTGKKARARVDPHTRKCYNEPSSR